MKILKYIIRLGVTMLVKIIWLTFGIHFIFILPSLVLGIKEYSSQWVSIRSKAHTFHTVNLVLNWSTS